MQEPILIEKESISTLSFSDSEKTKDAIKILRHKLNRATVLGNIDHNKIKILFKDEEGIKQVETTVWATGQDNIVLKSGTTIPISSIVDVKIL